MPAFFHGIGFWESCGEPFRFDGFSVFFQVCFDSFFFVVVCCFVEKKDHSGVFSAQVTEIIEEGVAVRVIVLAEELRAVFGKSAEPHGAPVRSCG